MNRDLDTRTAGRYAAVPMTKSSGATDPIKTLTEEFRRHLEIFYARLKLAPPYDSVEKAIKSLTMAVARMSAEERMRLMADPILTWGQYKQAFVDSGLSLKHRGIILGLIRSNQTAELPVEYTAFLEAYTSVNGSTQ
jgi:hypothetical protein